MRSNRKTVALRGFKEITAELSARKRTEKVAIELLVSFIAEVERLVADPKQATAVRGDFHLCTPAACAASSKARSLAVRGPK
jgi:hypothetical protein